MEAKQEKLRRPLDDDMLDLEKNAFAKEMNFQTKIPKFLVKLSATYYTKVSKLSTKDHL